MSLLQTKSVNCKELFLRLYNAGTEKDVETVFQKCPSIFKNPDNWFPLGGEAIENNFSVIENQKSSSIDALIEKITNSIDAILMRKAYESGIDPKSPDAPSSIDDAIKTFFKDYSNWNLSSYRRPQSECIQIIADGPRMDTSLIIYDDGEGQHPEDFEKTLLSLLKGNKNEIHFVHGKYNQGGTGSIVFCGKKRYQLIASKKYDDTGNFGFTVIRKHPLSDVEEITKKSTWYEYLKINNSIPSFETGELDLGLHNRKFKTGTVIKMYSYDLPSGSRSVISVDLRRSINEYLFNPALPILTVDKPERYPDDKNLQRESFGLKRKLEQDNSKYIEDYFTEKLTNHEIGEDIPITCYVFKPKIEGKTVEKSIESIQGRFFKNNMSVLFSLNGQVHGHLTYEFITRTLKMPLLKKFLLIHVDCTGMNIDFKSELFMASRDRVKAGEEFAKLRSEVSKKLKVKESKLTRIYKDRKDSISSVEGGDANELLKSFTKTLPLNSDLLKLLDQAFKLDQKEEKSRKKNASTKKKSHTKEPFKPQRFPSYFKMKHNKDGNSVVKIPKGNEKSIHFESDVENHYFERAEEPGDLKIALVDFKPNDRSGGTNQGSPKKISAVLNVQKSSPENGTIKIILEPTEKLLVGDSVRILATLESPGEDFNQLLWVKISDPIQPKEKTPKEQEIKTEDLGLPQYELVYNNKKENFLTWEKFSKGGIEMGFETVMYPLVEGKSLKTIYINMDSTVLKKYKSKLRTPSIEQLDLADRKYITSVYFHTIFLYTITKKRHYTFIQHEGEKETPKDIADYLKDLFESCYSDFLLNFGLEQLMQSLEE